MILLTWLSYPPKRDKEKKAGDALKRKVEGGNVKMWKNE